MVKDDGIVTDHAIFRKMVLGLGNKRKTTAGDFGVPQGISPKKFSQSSRRLKKNLKINYSIFGLK